MLRIIFVVVVAIFTGCASTNHTGFYDAENFSGKYSRVMVIAIWPDIAERKIIEDIFCSKFSYSVTCETLISYVPPTRTLDSDSLQQALEKSKPDALIQVAFNGVEEYVTTLSEKIYVGKITSIETKVVDLGTGENSYISTSKTNNDSGMAGFRSVIKSYSYSVYKDMLQKGII